VNRANLLACTLAAAVLAAPSGALAGRETGRLAPEIHAATAWNASAGVPALRHHRGRLVLLEFFSVDCTHCRAALPTLDAWHRAASGLCVLAASAQPRERIETFVREQRVAFPVVQVPVEVLEDYAVTGYPEAFLVGTDGRILWSGDPRRLDAAALARFRTESAPWSADVERLEGAVARLRGDDAAGARAALDRCAVGEPSCPAERTAVRSLRDWIDRWAATLLRVAAAEAANGDVHEAWKALDLLARAFAAAPEGADARARIERLLAEPAARREVEAGRAVDAARQLLAAGEKAAALVALDRVGRDHPGTKAAARAVVISARHGARRKRSAGVRRGRARATPAPGP
jgi:hypothetical protein